MKIILVDTSVWIDFFSVNETPASNYLAENISRIIIATCPIILQKVLQGVNNDKVFNQLKTYYNDFLQLNTDNHLSIQAALLYRDLRKKGITIRKVNDCLIACYALNNNIPILHNDRDFAFIEDNTDLERIEF